MWIKNIMLLTNITAAQNEVTLSYHRVCGLYFLAVAAIFGNNYSGVMGAVDYGGFDLR